MNLEELRGFEKFREIAIHHFTEHLEIWKIKYPSFYDDNSVFNAIKVVVACLNSIQPPTEVKKMGIRREKLIGMIQGAALSQVPPQESLDLFQQLFDLADEELQQYGLYLAAMNLAKGYELTIRPGLKLPRNQ